ncbi:MAG: hypothetical protein R3E12_17565 [Candidatus Eisenbacteria bacterium]
MKSPASRPRHLQVDRDESEEQQEDAEQGEAVLLEPLRARLRHHRGPTDHTRNPIVVGRAVLDASSVDVARLQKPSPPPGR